MASGYRPLDPPARSGVQCLSAAPDTRLERPMKIFEYVIGIVALAAFFLLIVELGGYFADYAHLFKLANLSILGLFMLHVVMRFLRAPDKRDHVKRNWLDAIVFIPLIQFVGGIQRSPAWIIVWRWSSSSCSSRAPGERKISSPIWGSGPRRSCSRASPSP
jgi:hypothetical protein